MALESMIPATENETVAKIAAALVIAHALSETNFEKRLSQFKKAYQEISAVVNQSDGD